MPSQRAASEFQDRALFAAAASSSAAAIATGVAHPHLRHPTAAGAAVVRPYDVVGPRPPMNGSQDAGNRILLGLSGSRMRQQVNASPAHASPTGKAAAMTKEEIDDQK